MNKDYNEWCTTKNAWWYKLMQVLQPLESMFWGISYHMRLYNYWHWTVLGYLTYKLKSLCALRQQKNLWFSGTVETIGCGMSSDFSLAGQKDIAPAKQAHHRVKKISVGKIRAGVKAVYRKSVKQRRQTVCFKSNCFFSFACCCCLFCCCFFWGGNFSNLLPGQWGKPIHPHCWCLNPSSYRTLFSLSV